MSYDLAVWEGRRPDGDDEASEIFAELAERYLEDDEVPATPKIARFVEALVQRWGDLEGTEDSPWATGRTGGDRRVDRGHETAARGRCFAGNEKELSWFLRTSVSPLSFFELRR